MGRLLHYASLLCCAFVVVSFALFAHTQATHASSTQINAVNGAPPASAPQTHHRSGQPRRFIDQVAGDLTSPFKGIVSSGNAWVNHGVPTLCALLVYGFGLSFLARWATGRGR